MNEASELRSELAQVATERDRYKAALEYIVTCYGRHDATNEVAYRKAKEALGQPVERPTP
jgi:hypothetical protein